MRLPVTHRTLRFSFASMNPYDAVKKLLTQINAWWKENSTVRDNDSKAQVAYKRFIQIGGLVLLFLISPVLVLAIVFLAFITV